MEEQGRGLHPDVVLLQYCLNDLTLGSSVLMPVDEDTSRLIQGPVQTDLPNVLLRSRLATWVAINYGFLHATSNGGRAPGPEEGYQQSLTCLTRLKEVVEEEGAELIVVLFPPFFTDAPSSTDVMLFRYDYAWAEAAAARLTQEAHLASIRLRGPLAARGRLEEMRNDPRDPWHPSSQTQLVIGDILARDLIGWLKAKQGGGM